MLYQKGATALQRQNFDYALAIFQQVLQREPAFLECRQALRAAQIKKTAGNTGFFKKMLGGASNSPLIAKAQMARSRPLKRWPSPSRFSKAIRKVPPATRFSPKQLLRRIAQDRLFRL